MQESPFEYRRHLVVVPVTLNGVERRFILDSGMGLTLVRDTIGGCTATGTSFGGRRMSGQEVSAPLATAPSLEFAGCEETDAEVGLLDMSAFPGEFDDVDGFLALPYFARQPFTVDYRRRVVRDGREAGGTAVPIYLVHDGPALTAFLRLVIPGGRTLHVEVDMGSDSLILDERFAAEVGVRLDGDEVRRVEGTDETEQPFTRSFTRLTGTIHPAGAPHLAQRDPEVMFQQIIYDGLIGHAYLKTFVVTWDLPAARLLLDR